MACCSNMAMMPNGVPRTSRLGHYLADSLRPLLAFSNAFISTASLSDDATHLLRTFSVSTIFFGVVLIFAPLFPPTFRTLFANLGVTYALSSSDVTQERGLRCDLMIFPVFRCFRDVTTLNFGFFAKAI